MTSARDRAAERWGLPAPQAGGTPKSEVVLTPWMELAATELRAADDPVALVRAILAQGRAAWEAEDPF